MAKPFAVSTPLLDVQAANSHADAQPQSILPFMNFCNFEMPLISVRSVICCWDGIDLDAPSTDSQQT